jgi:hypothetical protein
MLKSDSINTYLRKVSEIRDQLKAIGDEVSDAELVTISLNGLPISWEPFIQSICGRKKLPKFDNLWSDCVQEETRMLSRKILQKPPEEKKKKKSKHLQPMQEKGKENSRRRIQDHQERGGIFQRFNATFVMSLATFVKIVLKGKEKQSNMH